MNVQYEATLLKEELPKWQTKHITFLNNYALFKITQKLHQIKASHGETFADSVLEETLTNTQRWYVNKYQKLPPEEEDVKFIYYYLYLDEENKNESSKLLSTIEFP